MNETWLSTQGEESKTVEFALSGFHVKSFTHQLQDRGGGVATI